MASGNPSDPRGEHKPAVEGRPIPTRESDPGLAAADPDKAPWPESGAKTPLREPDRSAQTSPASERRWTEFAIPAVVIGLAIGIAVLFIVNWSRWGGYTADDRQRLPPGGPHAAGREGVRLRTTVGIGRFSRRTTCSTDGTMCNPNDGVIRKLLKIPPRERNFAAGKAAARRHHQP